MAKTTTTYNEAVAELEAILAKMESNECDIDSLSQLTARALELLKFCKERLLKTDSEIEKCLSELSSSLK